MPDAAPIRVFVVEDQPPILKALVKFLATREELEVVGTAMSGEAAVADLAEGPPDVLLLDLELPGMDGLAVLRALKPRHPAMQVLILTTFDDETKVYEAVKDGASGYLVKRMAPEKVADAISEVHAGGVVIEARIARRFWNYFDSVRATPPDRDTRGLTAVELEVLQFIAKGLSNAEVGRVMDIERRTVRTHLAHIYEKLEVTSHVEAVVAGLKLGLVDL
jgi:two-component system response regulator DegU